MNRFGFKTQPTQIVNTQAQIPCFFPSALLNQQPTLSLFNNMTALNQPMNFFPTNQFSYDAANQSDDEDLEEQEIGLILQQNLLLNCLISQIESDIGQISSNLQKNETAPVSAAADNQTASNVPRRRTTNGIRKLSEKTTGSKASCLSSLLKKTAPKKLTKRKMILSKKLCVSRKIAERLFKKQAF